ncbi:MAG: hypothetical protein HYY06_14875 [Deltaproteobacteria bacterium]|nr:hypothetical protein [Deltaproteobacteria bacterium]
MRVLVVLTMTSVLPALPVVAGAQPSEEDTAAARVLFEEGRRLASEESWSEAADRFRRALSLRASPAIRYNLAVALEHIGKLVEASEQLRLAAREAPERDPARRPAEQLLASIGPRIGRLTVYVEADLAGAEVLLDGRPLAAALFGVATPVDPGVHVVTVRRGAAERSREVEISEGGEARLTAPELPASPAAGTSRPGFVAGPASDRRDEPAPVGQGGVSWPLVLAGAGLVGGGVAVDLAPSSARNGTFDALDLVPIALYGGGAVLAALGVFR